MAYEDAQRNAPNANGRKSPHVAASRRQPLHRLGEIRQRKRIPLRVVARRMGASLAEVKAQEHGTADIPLSALHKWQQALAVPLAELLVDRGTTLTPPVMNDAQLKRVMGTATKILETTRQPAVRRLAQALVDQLIQIMPELQALTNGKGGDPQAGGPRPAHADEHDPPENLFLCD
jgi:transcriptional regulator with XRE-family HTH domain